MLCDVGVLAIFYGIEIGPFLAELGIITFSRPRMSIRALLAGLLWALDGRTGARGVRGSVGVLAFFAESKSEYYWPS